PAGVREEEARGRGAGEQVGAEEEARAARGKPAEGSEPAAPWRVAARERERRRAPAAAEEDAGAAVPQASAEGDALTEEGEIQEAREARVAGGPLPDARDHLESAGARVVCEQRVRCRRAEDDRVGGGSDALVLGVERERGSLRAGVAGG